MTGKRLVYEEPRRLTHAEALEKLATRDPRNISDALVAIGLFEEDYEFASQVILHEVTEPDPVIRGAALVALAHLARVHRKIPEPAIGIIRIALKDPDEYIRGQAETAADDIERFVPDSYVHLRD